MNTRAEFLSFLGLGKMDERRYQVTVPGEKFEIRTYENIFYVRTKFSSSLDDLHQRALPKVRNYFKGDNFKRKNLVDKTFGYISLLNQEWELNLALPATVNPLNHPKPIDETLSFFQAPVRRVAVFKFAGAFNISQLTSMTHVLNSWINEKNLRSTLPPMLSVQFPNRTIPFFTNNELLLELE